MAFRPAIPILNYPPKHVAGSWTGPDCVGQLASFNASSIDFEYALPLIVTGGRFDRIGGRCLTASVGALLRLGIRRCNPNGSPGSLILDAGTLDGNSVAIQEIVINIFLPKGKYFLTATPQGAVGAAWGSASSPIGSSNANTTRSGYWGFIYQTGISGALPDSFTGTSPVGACPFVTLRMA